MQDLEEKTIHNFDLQLPLYFRYIDDIILLASSNEVDNILNTFNKIHDRLQFTLELENKGSLNFLDLSLIVSGDTLVLDWYRKDTYSGRYLLYYSGHSLCHQNFWILSPDSDSAHPKT